MTYDGLSESELAARVSARRCLVLERVGSTLDVVHQLAADGAPAGTVVLADEQLAGRGQRGRKWLSPPGSGIWLGYLVRSDGPVGGVMSLRVSLAAVAALGELDVPAAVKWPNDVMLGSKKLAGILCEARSGGSSGAAGADEASGGGRGNGWVAVGIGINVRGPVPAEVADTAAAISEVQPHVTRVDVLQRLIPKLNALAPAEVLTAVERAAYERCDWLAGRRIVEPLKGRVEGVDADGALLVATARGRRRVLAGSVVPG
ncbi:MAG TPA: biotin--[acetyl-CoA-carboxylase] ligase [Gemmatimonadales bacterium]|nr:biotin--[acetyl-CoA-carboxylase] ligase [Gemmatimonadales bacterium]